MTNSIGITLGDVTGIGPEVTLKALAARKSLSQASVLMIGDVEHTLELNARLRLGLQIEPGPFDPASGRIYIVNPLKERLPAGLVPGAPEAARAAVAWLREGAERCLRGELVGLVTAPVNKAAIVLAGQPFVGQTEFLSQLAGTADTAMMLLGHDDRGRWLRVALATTHLPLKDVSRHLCIEGIERVILLAAGACRDLSLPQARVAVCGLNPHAGEGGNMGDEELRIIAPAIEAARSRGVDATGPFSADALFHYAYRGDYDAVVAMYHDQGLCPLKMVAFESGVNWTLGLPFVRTSPDHGTAYDIAGQNRAHPSSMMAAIQLALQVARR